MEKPRWTRRDAFRATGVAAGLLGTHASARTRRSANLYTRIGVKPFINLTATYTINGGALTLPQVKRAMD
ncbi:MAG: hypothetical protein ACRD7E_20240, partial [Bryobacteraceae bacterium]